MGDRKIASPNMPLSDTSMPNRLVKILSKSDIHTIGELSALEDKAPISTKGIGSTYLKSIQLILEEYGFRKYVDKPIKK